jgi:hypothetical protein
MPTVTPLPLPRLPDAAAGVMPGGAAARRAAPAAAEPDRPAMPAAALPNPTLRLDASLGLVVLEFRDARGESRTIPSQRELDAYREAARGVAPEPDEPARGSPPSPPGGQRAQGAAGSGPD